MTSLENLSMLAQIVALIFLLGLLSMLVYYMKKDGNLTPDEAAKVIILGSYVYMLVVNANHAGDVPKFGSEVFLISMGAILGLAGIDYIKLGNENKKDNSKNGK